MNFRRFTYSLIGIGLLLIAKLGFATTKPTDKAIILESKDSLPDIHYHGSHSSHCSHASHYSAHIIPETSKIHAVRHDSIGSITIDSKFKDNDSLNCIVKAYVVKIQLSDSSKVHFCGKVIIIAVKDDYGNYSRSPRIKVTTHIIPIDSSDNMYFTSNGHIGFSNLCDMYTSLESKFLNQFNSDWLLREKKTWMYTIDDNFYNNILDLTY